MSTQALLVKIVTKILFGQCTFSKSHQTTVLAAGHRPAHLKKNRDLDHVHAIGRDHTRVGGSTDALSSYVSQNRHNMMSGQEGYGGVPGCCAADPVSGYQMLSSYFYVSQVSLQTYIDNVGMVSYLDAVQTL